MRRGETVIPEWIKVTVLSAAFGMASASLTWAMVLGQRVTTVEEKVNAGVTREQWEQMIREVATVTAEQKAATEKINDVASTVRDMLNRAVAANAEKAGR
jgi:ABC-type Fe3+-hydroxamate transport system substrate-binding protein